MNWRGRASGSSCRAVRRRLLHAAMKTTSDKRATVGLLIAIIEAANSESGELLTTTLAMLECFTADAPRNAVARAYPRCWLGVRRLVLQHAML